MDHDLLAALTTPRPLDRITLRIDGTTHDLTDFVQNLSRTRQHLLLSPEWFRKLQHAGAPLADTEDEPYDLVVQGWEGTIITVHHDGTFTAAGVFDAATVEVTATDPSWAFAVIFEVEAEVEERLRVLASHGRSDASFTAQPCTFRSTPEVPAPPRTRTLGRHVRFVHQD